MSSADSDDENRKFLLILVILMMNLVQVNCKSILMMRKVALQYAGAHVIQQLGYELWKMSVISNYKLQYPVSWS